MWGFSSQYYNCDVITIKVQKKKKDMALKYIPEIIVCNNATSKWYLFQLFEHTQFVMFVHISLIFLMM